MNKNTEAVPTLAQMLEHASPMIAFKIIEALGRIGGNVAFSVLLGMMDHEDLEIQHAAADAVAGALAVVKAVAGDETASRVETTLNTLRATGMSAEQIATVAPLLAKAEAPVHENAEAKTRAGILAGIQNVHQNPVAASPGTVPTATTKSPLLADAERRAEVAK